jgi:hypothetical protein
MASKAVAVRRRRSLTRYSKPRAKAKFTLPLAVVLGFAPLAYHTWWHYKAGGMNEAVRYGVNDMTGYDMVTSTWQPASMARGLLPILLGFGLHKFVGGSLGLNRAIARAGIPVLRI